MQNVRTGRVGAPKIAHPKQAVDDDALPVCQHIKQGGNDRFIAFHGHGWDYIPDWQGGMWLPEIGELRHVPGGNGASLHSNDAHLAGMMKKGCIPIFVGNRQLPADPVVIDGAEYPGYRDYLASYDVRGGGKFWCYPAVTFGFSKGGRAVVPVNQDHARKWVYGFRQAVWDAGLIPPMSEDVLQSHLALLRHRSARDQSKVTAGKMDGATAAARQAERDDLAHRWNEAYDKQFGDEVIRPVAPPKIRRDAQPEQERLGA